MRHPPPLLLLLLFFLPLQFAFLVYFDPLVQNYFCFFFFFFYLRNCECNECLLKNVLVPSFSFLFFPFFLLRLQGLSLYISTNDFTIASLSQYANFKKFQTIFSSQKKKIYSFTIINLMQYFICFY